MANLGNEVYKATDGTKDNVVGSCDEMAAKHQLLIDVTS